MSAVGISAILAVVLLGVLTGFAVPALIQMRATLRSAQAFLDTTGRKLDRTLDEATEAISRLNRIGAEGEGALSRLRGLLDAVEDLAGSTAAARDALRKVASTVSAVGPALVAGLRAFWSRDDAQVPARRGSEAGGEEGATEIGEPGKETP